VNSEWSVSWKNSWAKHTSCNLYNIAENSLLLRRVRVSRLRMWKFLRFSHIYPIGNAGARPDVGEVASSISYLMDFCLNVQPL
jgi:hypothetical protein